MLAKDGHIFETSSELANTTAGRWAQRHELYKEVIHAG